jgi:hypothetical protein
VPPLPTHLYSETNHEGGVGRQCVLCRESALAATAVGIWGAPSFQVGVPPVPTISTRCSGLLSAKRTVLYASRCPLTVTSIIMRGGRGMVCFVCMSHAHALRGLVV